MFYRPHHAVVGVRVADVDLDEHEIRAKPVRDDSVASFVDRYSAIFGIESVAYGNYVSVVGHGEFDVCGTFTRSA